MAPDPEAGGALAVSAHKNGTLHRDHQVDEARARWRLEFHLMYASGSWGSRVRSKTTPADQSGHTRDRTNEESTQIVSAFQRNVVARCPCVKRVGYIPSGNLSLSPIVPNTGNAFMFLLINGRNRRTSAHRIRRREAFFRPERTQGPLRDPQA